MRIKFVWHYKQEKTSSGACKLIGDMALSKLAQELKGELLGEDVMFSNMSTDTRSIEKGDLYLALVGDNFDGNSFTEAAASSGAIAAIVSREVQSSLPVLRVADTHVALGKIANLNRRRSDAKVVALTGSQGKTTVKEMLGAILSDAAETLATEANLNNTIEDKHRYVVIEMGANRAGEIAFSVTATEPDIALITNASPAHIEGFGSLQGIVAAKGEIIDGLKNSGILLLNADDSYVEDWVQRAADKQIVRFSLSNATGDSQYFASSLVEGEDGASQFTLHTPRGEQALTTHFMGKHNVFNAVAATAAAMEAGATLQNVVRGLVSLHPVAGRLSRLSGLNGSYLIDDSYNASPGSFFAAIDVLSGLKGQKILVMGDMKELGDDTDSAHSSVGQYASKSTIDEVWAVGEKSKLAVDACAAKGRHFEDKKALIAALIAISSPGLTMLIKGSRGARMNEVVTALKIDGESE